MLLVILHARRPRKSVIDEQEAALSIGHRQAKGKQRKQRPYIRKGAAAIAAASLLIPQEQHHRRSEEHTPELQSLISISSAVHRSNHKIQHSQHNDPAFHLP